MEFTEVFAWVILLLLSSRFTYKNGYESELSSFWCSIYELAILLHHRKYWLFKGLGSLN